MTKTLAYTVKYTLQAQPIEHGASNSWMGVCVGMPIPNVRAVCWKDESVWAEATSYIAEKALERHALGASLAVLEGYAGSLRAYAEFLEKSSPEEVEYSRWDWKDFPDDRSKRPTYCYRGYLVKLVENGEVAQSTANRHMSVLLQFYDWAEENVMLRPGAEPYRRGKKAIRYLDQTGLSHSKVIRTSDLRIKVRRADRAGLEDGVFPITPKQRDDLLKAIAGRVSQEFVLVLKLGFFSGIRIGTIVSLTHSALKANFPSRELRGWHSIKVGPGTGVPNKGGVSYFPSIPNALLRELLTYCARPRRAIRKKRANDKDKDLVFLSQRGERLTGRSYSQEMTKLRGIASTNNLGLGHFHFHRSRATFGTTLVLMLLDAEWKQDDILPILAAAMGHTSAVSSLHYIKFIENDREMQAVEANYAKFLMGEVYPDED